MNPGVLGHGFRTFLLPALLLMYITAGWSAADRSDRPAGLSEMRQLAKNLVETGLYDAAVAAYREIVRFTPEQAQSQYDLAATLTFLRHYEEAIEPISAAERLDPADPRGPELAALIYFALKRHAEAAAASRRGAELGDIQAMFTLSGMYQRGMGVSADPEQALNWVLRAAEGGHLGAMDLLVQTYNEGLFGQAPDGAKAKHWTRRLREAEATVP